MIKERINEEINLNDYKITENPFSKCLIYLENDNIIGFLDYSIIYEKIEINYIFVKEEFRNKKIAAKLMKNLIENNLDKDNITLEVNVNNVSAIKLYKKFNFKEVAKRHNYYGSLDGILMEMKFYENTCDRI